MGAENGHHVGRGVGTIREVGGLSQVGMAEKVGVSRDTLQ